MGDNEELKASINDENEFTIEEDEVVEVWYE